MHAMELSSSGFLRDTTHTGAGSDGAGAEETFDRVTLCLDESPAASVQLPVQTFSRPEAETSYAHNRCVLLRVGGAITPTTGEVACISPDTLCTLIGLAYTMQCVLYASSGDLWHTVVFLPLVLHQGTCTRFSFSRYYQDYSILTVELQGDMLMAWKRSRNPVR